MSPYPMTKIQVFSWINLQLSYLWGQSNLLSAKLPSLLNVTSIYNDTSYESSIIQEEATWIIVNFAHLAK